MITESNNKKQQALEHLKRYYGYAGFRPGQWEVIEQTLTGRDTVVLMPTGGGKSLCFQLPALQSEGCCIVVSPLIALMKDQVQSLQTNGIPAASINSMVPESVNQEVYMRAMKGEIKLLYISPERLMTDIEIIRAKLRVSFFAVDEAHCISQWGHDFRPVYTSLSKIKELFPDIAVMALTATADRLTREDISKALRLEKPYMHIGSFDRPNLSLQVIQGTTLAQRISYISSLIDKYPLDCGIVYCLSRKKTEAMAEKLKEAGYRVGCYHAGMPPEAREKSQHDFVAGNLQAICATVAFGMGIDKSNIRWVVHNNIPGNIESYYQEIGRAGRDGLPAETILFYTYGDVLARMRFVEESGQPEINKTKLELMQKYAEAPVCRRRILLNYFSEESTNDCGNCDNCRSPRKLIDGTIHAQKALSAIIRTGCNEGLLTIIDILRGGRTRHILNKGYDMLPTFGVGSELSLSEWSSYILQMQQLGLVEVAYDDNFHLRPTDTGLRVVKGKEKIEMCAYETPNPGYTQRRKRRASAPANNKSIEERITETLKQLRKEMASELGLADYQLLSDVSIEKIAIIKPRTVEELYAIEGMSIARLALVYKKVLQGVRAAIENRSSIPQGSSDIVTRLMFDSGMTIEEISIQRKLAETTVTGHLMKEYLRGKDVDIPKILPPEKFVKIQELLSPLDELKETDIIAYSDARKEFEEHIEEHGFTLSELQRAYSLRRVLQVVKGHYLAIEESADQTIVSEPESEYGYDRAAEEYKPEYHPMDEYEVSAEASESDWKDWDV